MSISQEEMIELEHELISEIGKLSLKVDEAIKTLEWIQNFVKDKTIQGIVAATLLKIK